MIIIKIGGGETINLQAVAADLANMQQPCIVVHGANAARDRLAQDLSKPKKIVTSVSGFSSVFTDREALGLIFMAYAGLRNKQLVELCQRAGINAIGLTGIDGALIRAERNKGIRTKEGSKIRILHDFSGKPRSINMELLQWLLDHGYLPILTIPVLDENGYAVNTENDEIVALLHKEFHASAIVQLIEAPGLLQNPEDPTSLIPEVSQSELAAWMDRSNGRMKRKLLALGKILDQWSTSIYISDGRREQPITNAFNRKGTVIQ